MGKANNVSNSKGQTGKGPLGWERILGLVTSRPVDALLPGIDPQHQLKTARSMMVRLGDRYSTPLGVFNDVISACLHATYREPLESILSQYTYKPKGFHGTRYFCVYSNEMWTAELALCIATETVYQRMLYTSDPEFKDFLFAEGDCVQSAKNLDDLLKQIPAQLKQDQLYYSMSTEPDIVDENGFRQSRIVYALYLPDGYLR